MRSIFQVLLESVIIGTLVVLAYLLLNIGFKDKYLLVKLFIIGFLLHFGFEYTLVNENWCRNTYK